MDFFDKLGETITSKSKDVAKKAKEMAEVVSLNSKISAQEEVIKKTYADIGQKYYEKYNLNYTNEFVLECETITKAMDEIEQIKREIQALKNCKVCTKCGSEVANDAVFCPKCGAQFEVTSTESEPFDTTAQEVVDSEPEVVDDSNIKSDEE